MKILYAIQGTGNGHLARASHIVPLLKEMAEVDVLISGFEAELELPFPIDYQFKGLSFVFGKNGGIDFYATYRKNRVRRFYNEVQQLDVQQYDLVISDFEPVSAWACARSGKPCIGLSNQLAVLAPGEPRAKFDDPIGIFVLKHYAPVSKSYGFHFQSYNENITTPIIRNEVQQLVTTDEGHYVVYLPAYSDKRVLDVLTGLPDVKWEVFSKRGNPSNIETPNNINIHPINQELFLQKMASASGVLCAAGFTTPSEALYLNKKLMVIPQKNQYEQQCNAVALKKMGIPVMKSLKIKHLTKLAHWIDAGPVIDVDYQDHTPALLRRVIEEHLQSNWDGAPRFDMTFKLSY